MTNAGLLALLSHWRRNPMQLFTLVAVSYTHLTLPTTPYV